MTGLAIALDLGTSGFRAQAIDLSDRAILATVITTRHPLPGLNSIDHLHYALDAGLPVARSVIMNVTNAIIRELGIPADSVVRLAVCGNPAQLSLFQGMEIRDLAFAGSNTLASLGAVIPDRRARIARGSEFPGLCLPPGCEVVIPPSIRHEVGADALGLILQSGMLEKSEIAVAIDFGTNAEMALLCNGHVHTASAAAGPAIEGQQISCGVLAMPWAASDLERLDDGYRLVVLNEQLLPAPGPRVYLDRAAACDDTPSSLRVVGITGTGTIAVISQAMDSGLLALPRILTPGRTLHPAPTLVFTEKDLREAGKAIGAIRAGLLTLCHAAGISPADIGEAYLAGASGTFVDAEKVHRLGMIPSHTRTVYQIGNTSLTTARELAINPGFLERMSELAVELQSSHCMFASSETFKKMYILEYSYWTEGMPWKRYREFLRKYNLPDLEPPEGKPRVVRRVVRDIDDLGRRGLTTLTDIGSQVMIPVEGCTLCNVCEVECPAKALAVSGITRPPTIALDLSLCEGWACRHCEQCCPEKVFDLRRFFTAEPAARTRHGGV